VLYGFGLVFTTKRLRLFAVNFHENSQNEMFCLFSVNFHDK